MLHEYMLLIKNGQVRVRFAHRAFYSIFNILVEREVGTIYKKLQTALQPCGRVHSFCIK